MNRSKKTIGRNVLGIIGFAMLAPCLFFLHSSVQGAEKEMTIKMATLAPDGSSWMKTFQTLNTEVMKKTDNKVKFRIYPGGVLGDETDMLRKMQIGQIQAAALTAAGLSVLFKEIDVLQIPFLFRTYEEVDHVLPKMDGFFRKGFEDHGCVLLGWSEAGFVYLMSTVPISGVPDLKRAKVWIWEQSSTARVIFDDIGVRAIPLSVPDVLVGLQTGLVEVVYAPPTGAISLQWFTRIKYMTDVPLVYVGGGVLVKKETFKQMPQAFQEMLLESFQRHLNELKSVTRNENREAVKVMEKHGVKVIRPSKEQIDEFRKVSARAMAQPSSRSFSPNVLEEVSSLLATYRKEAK